MTIKNIRRYPLSLFLTALVLYLSFFPVPHTELEDVPFIDKWVHIVMYGGYTLVMWIEYLRSHARIHFTRTLLGFVIAPVVLSGIIELLQEYCTTTRSGDWFDLLANALGIVLSALAGYTFLGSIVRLKRR